MEITTHITAIGREGARLAEAAALAGLDAPVPWCPGWDVRELLRHLSEIHLWAASHVAKRALYDGGVADVADLEAVWPELAVFWPEDGALVDYYLATNANLLTQLESAPADLETWTFLPAPSPLQMWARRQAHETAIHRFDAESASGAITGYDPAFASDGIDEILTGFAPRVSELPLDGRMTMAVRPSDVGERWVVTLGPDGITTVRDDGSADVSLSGLASDLYLAVWNRGDDSTLEIAGDRSVLEVWRNRHKSRWPRTRDADDARANASR